MNDDLLFADLRALDRPVNVEPSFADRLFERLRHERRPRSRRLPLLLLAATLLLGGSTAAFVVGGGGAYPSKNPTAPLPANQIWTLRESSGEIRFEYAVPTDLDLIVTDGRTYLAFTAGSDVAYTLDDTPSSIPAGARGMKISDVAGATAHYSNSLPLGTDAASFLEGLATHRFLGADVGPIANTQLGGVPALIADLRKAAPQAHLDRQGVVTELWTPSRLIVADVGDAIVLVQIWAGNDEGLADWLPDAQRLVASLRIDEGT